MLSGKQRGGHQYHHLRAVGHRLERRADGDLGLAEARVPANHPVHGDRAGHVRLHLVDAGELIGGLGVGKGVFQLPLPRGVRTKGATLGLLPGRVELHQPIDDLPDCPSCPTFRLLPVAAAEAMHRGCLAPDIAGHLVQLVGGDEQPVRRLAAFAGCVLDHQVLPGRAAHSALHHLHVAAHTVLFVHHVVAGGQGERVHRSAPPGRHLASGRRFGRCPPDIGLREQGHRRARHRESVGERRHGHSGFSGQCVARLPSSGPRGVGAVLGGIVPRPSPRDGYALFAQRFGQTLGRTGGARGEHHRRARLDLATNRPRGCGHVAAELDCRGRIEPQHGFGLVAEGTQLPPAAAAAGHSLAQFGHAEESRLG